MCPRSAALRIFQANELNRTGAVSASHCLTKSRTPPKFDIVMRIAFSLSQVGVDTLSVELAFCYESLFRIYEWPK